MKETIETYKILADLYELYVGKFDYDFDFYKSFCNNSDKIIEIGCGTGRILDILLRKGCKVTGADISQEMLNKAYEKLGEWINTDKLTLINHDFSTKKLYNRFDKALLTYYTFNYILDNPVDFLKNIHYSLNNNGLLLMDLFYPNPLFDNSINGRWIVKEYNIDETIMKIFDNRTMFNDIELRRQIFNFKGAGTKIDTSRKYYSPVELKELLNSAGFKKVEFAYDYDYCEFKPMIDESKLNNNYIVKAEK